jgi:hypothetical protein
MQEFKKPGVPGTGQALEQKTKGPAIKLPDMHAAARIAGMKDLDLESLDKEEEESEQEESEDEQSEEQKAEQEEAREQRRRNRRAICFCADEACRIGPFTILKED